MRILIAFTVMAMTLIAPIVIHGIITVVGYSYAPTAYLMAFMAMLLTNVGSRRVRLRLPGGQPAICLYGGDLERH
ncbi:MAG: hypothetical protein ABWW69_02355 [Pyrodictiaceae archaeon]